MRPLLFHWLSCCEKEEGWRETEKESSDEDDKDDADDEFFFLFRFSSFFFLLLSFRFFPLFLLLSLIASFEFSFVPHVHCRCWCWLDIHTLMTLIKEHKTHKDTRCVLAANRPQETHQTKDTICRNRGPERSKYAIHCIPFIQVSADTHWKLLSPNTHTGSQPHGHEKGERKRETPKRWVSWSGPLFSL